MKEEMLTCETKFFEKNFFCASCQPKHRMRCDGAKIKLDDTDKVFLHAAQDDASILSMSESFGS